MRASPPPVAAAVTFSTRAAGVRFATPSAGNAKTDVVLKDAGVKLKGGRKRKALVEHNAAAWAQGKRDAKQIDLNQNSVGDRK